MGSSGSPSPLKHGHRKSKHKKRNRSRNQNKGYEGQYREKIYPDKGHQTSVSINNQRGGLPSHTKSRKRSNSSISSGDHSPKSEKESLGRRNSSYKQCRNRKLSEVDRLTEMERHRRHTETEKKIVEEKATQRIEFLVKKRVEEELKKRQTEIEQEVKRRVEMAKLKMEHDIMIEMERRREQIRKEQRRREEEEQNKREELEKILAENNRRIEEAQRKLVYLYYVLARTHGFIRAEERLAIIEEQRLMDEERQRMQKEQEKRLKEEQRVILGKNNSRPKLSFSLKPGTS